jgi:hypothetical protein
MPTDRSSTRPGRYALESLFGPGQDGMVSHVRVVAWQEDRARPVVAGNGKFLLS